MHQNLVFEAAGHPVKLSPSFIPTHLEESRKRHDDLVLVLPLHAVQHHVTVANGGRRVGVGEDGSGGRMLFLIELWCENSTLNKTVTSV